ncbi:MAG: hypothetical protein Q8R34_01605 [bacterium]|nr:hypothetical protein [bacterium]
MGGLIRDDYQKSLVKWKSSCSFREAREKLKVSAGTILGWKRKKIIKTVKVLGFERILLSSIEKIIHRRKIGTFSLHPTHSFPGLILEITGIGYPTLKEALDKKIVLSAVINGVRMISNTEVEKIRREWTTSCRSFAVQKILGKSKGVVARLVAKRQLPTVTVMGQRRIELDSIAKTSEEKERMKDYLRLEKEKYKRRVRAGAEGYKKLKNKKRKTKKLIQKFRKFRAKQVKKTGFSKVRTRVRIPNYTPQPVQVRGFESKRLATLEEAARALGINSFYINDLYMAGKLRGEIVGDRVYIYILSLEKLIAQRKQG